MSVLIKGMTMPDSCEECKLYVYDSSCSGCLAELRIINREKNENKPKWCPLIELPDHHGNLIDRTPFLNEKFIRIKDDKGIERYMIDAFDLLKAPVIIPAERSEE